MAHVSVPKWHVMIQSGGLLMRKYETHYSAGEAFSQASALSYEGVAPTVYVFESPGRSRPFPGWELVGTWTEGEPDEVTSRFLADQALTGGVETPSLRDELGEEMGP